MSAPNIEADAFQGLKSGGIALIPTSIGYILLSTTPQALEKIFLTKNRTSFKRHKMLSNYNLIKGMQILEPVSAEIVKSLVHDFEMPLSVAVKYKPHHLIFAKLHNSDTSTANGTIASITRVGGIRWRL